jgi:hypothetical protein
MNRFKRNITWTLVCLMSFFTLSGTSCENVNINYIVPLGFAGTPGVFNPFGIVQAFVNAWLGTVLPGSSSSSSASSSDSSSGIAPSPAPDLGAIGGVVVTQPRG